MEKVQENYFKEHKLGSFLIIVLLLSVQISRAESDTQKDMYVAINIDDNLTVNYNYTIIYRVLGDSGLLPERNISESEFKRLIDPFLFNKDISNKNIQLEGTLEYLPRGSYLESSFTTIDNRALFLIRNDSYSMFDFHHPFISSENYPMYRSIWVNLTLPFPIYSNDSNNRLLLIAIPGENISYDRDIKVKKYEHDRRLSIEFTKSSEGYSLPLLIDVLFVLSKDELPILVEESNIISYPAGKIKKQDYIRNNEPYTVYLISNLTEPLERIWTISSQKPDLNSFSEILTIEPQEKVSIGTKDEAYFYNVDNCNFMHLADWITYPFDCTSVTGDTSIYANLDLRNPPLNILLSNSLRIETYDSYIIDEGHSEICVFPSEKNYPQIIFVDDYEIHEKTSSENTSIETISFTVKSSPQFNKQINSSIIVVCDSRSIPLSERLWLNYTGTTPFITSQTDGRELYTPPFEVVKVGLKKSSDRYVWYSDNNEFSLKIPYSSYHLRYKLVFRRSLIYAVIIPFLCSLFPLLPFSGRKLFKSLKNKNKIVYYSSTFSSILLIYLTTYLAFGNPASLFLQHKATWSLLLLFIIIICLEFKKK